MERLTQRELCIREDNFNVDLRLAGCQFNADKISFHPRMLSPEKSKTHAEASEPSAVALFLAKYQAD